MSTDPTAIPRQLDELLRRCVECGLCLPHCATWAETGNEVHSPRGRLALLGDLLDPSTETAGNDYLEAFDLCIGCRACEAACPSGVPFTLLEKGQELSAGQTGGRPGGSPILRHLDSRSFLSAAGTLGGLARKVLSTLLGRNWRPRLENKPLGGMARLLSAMPRSFESDEDLLGFLDARRGQVSATGQPYSAKTSSRATAHPTEVVFFSGCANSALLGGTSRRLLDLLRAAGCNVVVPEGQDCCGALATHTGRPGRAAALRRSNRTAFASHLAPGSRVLVEAAGCGLEMKENYGGDLAGAVTDVVVLLDELELPPLGSVPLKVVYHDPCHARHGQGIIDQPRRLLSRIPGLQLVDPLEAEVCCGSGGAWGLNHPELSSRLGRRKAANLAATGADLVLTSNPGCLGQIADGLALEAPDLPIMPLTDLLWYAWQIQARSGTGTAPS